MLRGLLRLFEGYCSVQVPRESTVSVLNILRQCGIAYWRMRNEASGEISFRVTSGAAKVLLSACDKEDIAVTVSPAHGLPSLMTRYRRRWGIPIGAAAFALITLLSCRVVWEVDVTGNEKMDTGQIVRMLDEYGFGVGTPFGSIDFDVLQNEFLLTTDEIAWISVNMVGTVAHVQVRENLGGKRENSADTGTANIVAREDGQITEVQVRSGKAAVTVHDVVQKGDLLIGGIIAVRGESVRYEHADGCVYAKVRRRISVEIPTVQEKKIYTGEESVRKSIIFFGKQIKLFGKSSIDTPTYDTILSEKSISLPTGGTLPIVIREEKDRAYRTETVSLDKTEAYAAAVRQYRQEIAALLETSEIVSVEAEHSFDGQVYRITADLWCVTDIADVSEIITS